ncbi:MAG: glycosyltransferase [Chloroflexi bacterium]|nr:glycosyltransferase [Chloroflexota bacterium]
MSSTAPPDQHPAASLPTFSVVIAAVNGYAPLARCLQAIERLEGRAHAEVIVIDRANVARRLKAEFPATTLVTVSPEMTIPEMRSLGMRLARGEWVIVTEDHCEPRPDWLQRFQAAASGPWDVIAGAVVNGRRQRLVDWAAFFTEYSEYMAPRPAGETADLPGMNTAYRRQSLLALPGLVEAGLWETFLHARLQAAGCRLYAAADVLVDHCKSFGYREFLSQRFYLARSFAGMRLRGAPPVKRLAYGLAAPALLFLLPVRTFRRIWRKGAHRRELLLSFPILLSFFASWAAGEMVGYLFGEGDASRKVE